LVLALAQKFNQAELLDIQRAALEIRAELKADEAEREGEET